MPIDQGAQTGASSLGQIDPLGALGLFLQTLGFLALALVVLGALAFAVGWAWVIWMKNKDREEKSLEFALLSISVPRDNEIKIDAAEQMFASLASIHHESTFSFLKPHEHFSFEIVALPEEMKFYISCPKELQDLVEKQIHGSYPGAEVKEVDEYNIFSEDGKLAFAALKLKSASYYPIKTFKDLAVDPLSQITSALAKMRPGEGAAIQVIAIPTGHKWKSAGKRFVSKTKEHEMKAEGKSVPEPKKMEAIENKIEKPGFEVLIRIMVSAKTDAEAKVHLDNIKSTFAQFSSEYNGFTGANIRFKKQFLVDFVYRYQPLFGKMGVLNSEELASVFHLPNKSVETPGIFWVNAKRAPAPAQIPSSGLHLGKSVYRGTTKEVYVSEDDRRRHMYIIGKTGTGKTETLKYLAMQDIKAGHGICFIDPHGDAAEDILAQVPPERAEDVIYFNPADTERPLGMNMLEASSEQEKHFIASNIVGLMYKLYDPHKTGIIGPRFEHAIRNAMLTVMSEPGNTFVEIVRVLTDTKFVQELLPKVQDPVVRRYWTDQIAQTSDFHKSEVLDYIVSKFGRFVTDSMMRNIIGQSKSAFNIREVMDQRKILIVNLSKGRMGEENSAFMGLVLVPKILVAAMSRQDVPEEQRPDFFLYVDEFQNYATETFADILAEARKFHLNLVVANQFIGQIEEEVKNAIFGNVGTVMSFRIGVTDANYLQHEFTPVFNETDLINVERFHAYVKTIVRNETVPPFSIDTTRDMSKVDKDPRIAEMIKQLSRLRYGRDVNVVDAEIVHRAKL
ncbi:MAG TPA: type IV secretion system DNA-binding domain-containing protein [Candidatus Saccharimonadales bacterium]|nr:type IV secretion system DNA-binding domain-containing protein [Candidatus Saccharimonadales bacterium]